VGRFANWDEFRRLEKLGLTMYGQMTAGSWIYIGSQGIVQGTYETFVAARKAHEARTAADNAELESRERLLVLLCADNEALRNALRDAAESSAAARHGVDAAHAAVAAAVASVRTGASLADQPPAGEQQHIERARKYKALARELHVRLRTVTQAHAAELAAMRAKLREAYHAVGTPSSTPLHS
jgi:hypothetical protein